MQKTCLNKWSGVRANVLCFAPQIPYDDYLDVGTSTMEIGAGSLGKAVLAVSAWRASQPLVAAVKTIPEQKANRINPIACVSFFIVRKVLFCKKL